MYGECFCGLYIVSAREIHLPYFIPIYFGCIYIYMIDVFAVRDTADCKWTLS